MGTDHVSRAEFDDLVRRHEEVVAALVEVVQTLRHVADMSAPQRTDVRPLGSVTAAVAAIVAERPDVSVAELAEATGGSVRHVRRVLRNLAPATSAAPD